MTESTDVEGIFELSPPLARRQSRLARSRQRAALAAAVASAASAALLATMLLLL